MDNKDKMYTSILFVLFFSCCFAQEEKISDQDDNIIPGEERMDLSSGENPSLEEDNTNNVGEILRDLSAELNKDLRQTISDMRVDIVDMKIKMEEMADTKVKMEQMKASLMKDLQPMITEIQADTVDTKEKLRDMVDLKEKILKNEEKIAENANTIYDVNSTISDVKFTVEKYSAQITSVTEEVEQQKPKIESMTFSDRKQESMMVNNIQRLSSMDTKIADLKVNMGRNEGKIVKNNEIISDVKSIVEGHSAKISSLSEAVVQQEKSTESGDCNVVAEDRQDCGYPGITKEACNAKGCCFNNQQKNTFWCFTAKQTGDVTTTEGYAADLEVVNASSVYKQTYHKWGPEQALTEVSTINKNFWHSDPAADNPTITFKMQQEHEVLYVEVVDRQDCCHIRFKNVEVRIGSTLSFGDAQSCGVQSHEGKTTYKYLCNLSGQYVFIQKKGSKTILHVNHVTAITKEKDNEEQKGCKDGFNLWQGKCYRFEEGDKFTWKDARRRCHSLGTELVSIHSQAENDYVTSLISDTDRLRVWIGGTRVDAEKWAWIDGSKWSWDDGWSSGQPNNLKNKQDKILVYGNGNMNKERSLTKGKWDDAPSTWSKVDHPMGFVCAYKPYFL